MAKTKAPPSPKELALKEAKTLTAIRRILKIKQGEWDYILIGDGSATTWDRECGWACIQIESGTFQRQDYFGATNRGTNILAEMLAYAHPLWELVDRSDRRTNDAGFSRVHIVSDCEYVEKVGNGRNEPKKHKAAWAMFESFRRCGLLITFHWIPRDTISLNKLCHNLANSARKAMKVYPHTSRSLQQLGFGSIFDTDPA